MNKPLLHKALNFLSVKQNIFDISEERSQRLIQAMAFMLFLSCGLGGYSIFVSANYLLDNFWIASLLGLFTTCFLTLHDSSLLATENRSQIVGKIVISFVLAIAFVLTNSATKEYDTLKDELVTKVQNYNSDVRIAMNKKIEAIEDEEREILLRIEEAGQMVKINVQPLADARRTLTAFRNTKEDRIERIQEAYSPKFREAKISDFTILSLQAKKMLSGDESTVISFVLAFLFFILESLPAIVSVMLFKSDYMTRYIAELNVNRALRDQKIAQQIEFASESSDLIKCVLTMDLLEQKRQAILSDFNNQESLILLDKRLKILEAGYNPYTGEDLNHIDLDIFSTRAKEDKGEKSKSNGKDSAEKEEPVFAL